MTLADALTEATSVLVAAGVQPAEARVEARILVARAAQVSREDLIIHDGATLSPEANTLLAGWVTRRGNREPLAYVLGERAFYGMTFVVTPAVLIPRPETEFLVDAALHALKAWPDVTPRVADVGTGSGCVAVAIARNAPQAEVWASDISPGAVGVARENARRLGVAGAVRVYIGDLLTPLASAVPFAVIVSNPPYIAPGELSGLAPEVRDWEPHIALGTHADALHFYRRLAREAPSLLAPGGLLAVEVGQGQADAVQALWRDAGLSGVDSQRDMSGIARVVRGFKPA